MSGTNPFRRKTAEQSSYIPTATATGPVHSTLEDRDRQDPWIPPIDTNLARSTKTKTGKTVRIISPHSATSDSEHGVPHRFFSPPPIMSSSPPSDSLLSRSIEEDSPADPFSAESDRAGGNTMDQSTLQNSFRNSGNLQSFTGDVGAMPANPFKKTLASLGTDSRPDRPSQGSEGRLIKAKSSTTRPHYDVEDFKKLLLTGEKGSSGANAVVPPPVSFQSPAHAGDSSSNTDASSTSRQSIFEPVSGPVQESPRTSHESVLSDDERQRLVGTLSTASERIKPVTPEHRHGKLGKSTAPQTVSFEDPTLSSSDAAMSAMASVDRSMSGIDKPLPPLPSLLSIQSSMQNRAYSTNTDKQSFYPESEQSPSSNVAQKRSPPPPPLSRRHSQLRGKPAASSTERSTPITEEAAPESVLLSQSAPNASSKAPPPPPPPPRRAGLVRGNSSSSLSRFIPTIPISDQTNVAGATTRSSKPRPPGPPNRTPSVSSVNRPNHVQSNPGSPSVVPPPLPRRRGSSQSSYTPSRLSGHFTERLRSESSASSISHLAMTPAGPSSAENKDVMADLSALQREVDELRGKFKD